MRSAVAILVGASRVPHAHQLGARQIISPTSSISSLVQIPLDSARDAEKGETGPELTRMELTPATIDVLRFHIVHRTLREGQQRF